MASFTEVSTSPKAAQRPVMEAAKRALGLASGRNGGVGES